MNDRTLSGDELRLCRVDELEEGDVLRVDIDGQVPLAVYLSEGVFYVSHDTCSHGAASLSDGMVDQGRIECPWHTGSFCLKTGAALSFPAVDPIKVFPAFIKDGDVCIRLNETQS
jgi:nitrite reductase/ring-hydroxylating ferredoxin subunit